MRFPVSVKSGQSFSPLEKKKIVLYLSVRVFSTKVLIGDTIFTSPTGDGTLPVCRAKAVPSVLSYF